MAAQTSASILTNVCWLMKFLEKYSNVITNWYRYRQLVFHKTSYIFQGYQGQIFLDYQLQVSRKILVDEISRFKRTASGATVRWRWVEECICGFRDVFTVSFRQVALCMVVSEMSFMVCQMVEVRRALLREDVARTAHDMLSDCRAY